MSASPGRPSACQNAGTSVSPAGAPGLSCGGWGTVTALEPDAGGSRPKYPGSPGGDVMNEMPAGARPVDGIVSTRSPHSVGDTVARLSGLIREAGRTPVAGGRPGR